MGTEDIILRWIGIITVMYWVGVFVKYVFRKYNNSWNFTKRTDIAKDRDRDDD